MKIAEAVAAFTKDPKKFLEKNYVVIAGGKMRNPGPTIFQMTKVLTKVKGQGTFFHHLKNRPAWNIAISNNNNGNPGPTVALGPDELVGYYIPMKQQSDNVGVIFGQPPSDGSIDLILTSQLTGCTFAFSPMSGQFVAAHLQPMKNVTTAVTQKNMATIMQQGMSGSAHLVQKGVDYTDCATIVGKFDGSDWKLCMQKIDWNTANGGFKEITGIVNL